MKRREFIGWLVAGGAMRPLVAHAQQRQNRPTIGFLGAGSPENWASWAAAFEQQLARHGWVKGDTVAIEYRWGEGRPERYAETAAEFVRLKVDVIVTGGTPAFAVKQATSSIPIVGAIMGDPVGTGLVTSLSKPGGNVTGLSYLATDLAGKRLELLLDAVPQLKRLAVLGNVENPQVVLEMRELDGAAAKLSIAVTQLEIRGAQDVAGAFQALDGRAQAVYVCNDPLSNANRLQINNLALEARLPSMHGVHEYVEAGGLMSYGPDFAEMFRRAGDFVDKILRGTRPADIPVEQPTKFLFVINLHTAKALGIAIPASMQLMADEIIE